MIIRASRMVAFHLGHSEARTRAKKRIKKEEEKKGLPRTEVTKEIISSHFGDLEWQSEADKQRGLKTTLSSRIRAQVNRPDEKVDVRDPVRGEGEVDRHRANGLQSRLNPPSLWPSNIGWSGVGHTLRHTL